MEARKDVTVEFQEAYGSPPDGIWAAPGRVNLIGEHTDYNAGLVLPIALPQRTFAAAKKRDDKVIRMISTGMGSVSHLELDDIAPGKISGWMRYPAGVLWALNAGGYPVGGLDVAFASEVPIGSGLSSSAAIEGAMGAAASDLFGFDLLSDDAGRASLATLCQRAENEIAGAPTGGMDQAASLRAQAGHALYLDCADGSVTHVPFTLEDHGLTLLVIDTRAEHKNSDGQYGKRRADCEKACEKLGVSSLREIDPAALEAALARLSGFNAERLRKRVRHVVAEIERVRFAVKALQGDDFAELGRLFVDSHASMRDDYEISCAELDCAVTSALEAGALGARMTGGGFGGSAIALVYTDALALTEKAISTAFTAHRFAVPRFIRAVAAGPATRVE
jgi:galactokinase